MKKKWWLLKGLKFVAFGSLFVAGFGAITMLLWNALVPELFHGPVLSYVQAIGLLLLTHILFRGPIGRGGWKGRHLHHKLAHMSPEERERFFSQFGPFRGHGMETKI